MKEKPLSFTLQRHCRFYCFVQREKRLNFQAFATKSFLLRHAKRQKPQTPRFFFKYWHKSAEIKEKDLLGIAVDNCKKIIYNIYMHLGLENTVFLTIFRIVDYYGRTKI